MRARARACGRIGGGEARTRFLSFQAQHTGDPTPPAPPGTIVFSTCKKEKLYFYFKGENNGFSRGGCFQNPIFFYFSDV